MGERGRGSHVKSEFTLYDHNHYASLAYYIFYLALFYSHILLLQCLSLDSSYEV